MQQLWEDLRFGFRVMRRVEIAAVSAEFFDMLGVKPFLGTTFGKDQELPGSDGVMLISHGMWKTRFGGDAGIIGRKVRLDGQQMQVIGVLPEKFHFILLGVVNVILPLSLTDSQRVNRTSRFIQVVGIYTVVSYSVSRRMREMGIRSALGASRRQLVELVVGQGVRLAVPGLVVGVVLAMGLMRLMKSIIAELKNDDPLVYVGALLILASAVIVASMVPAWRAARVDPLRALRHE